MSFRRTNSGMSNLHLFHGVDAVVFVEGVPTSFTLEQLEQGLFNNQAEDLKYWRIVFTTFVNGKTFHFRAVGSKNALIELSTLIISKQIRRVIVAMDRDFQ